MPDLLVKLYDLPPATPVEGVTIRVARPFERGHLRDFIEEHFTRSWADEADAGFANRPVSTWLATEPAEGGRSKIVGFAGYDCTARGLWGPTGVAPSARGRGIGKALLLHSLHAMHTAGYAYAIIGGAGPVDFYRDTCGATVIDGSEPGFYRDLLKPNSA
ncbi:MAG: GNAT family N-acetyltransferase [Planctomycetota bacterium]